MRNCTTNAFMIYHINFPPIVRWLALWGAIPNFRFACLAPLENPKIIRNTYQQSRGEERDVFVETAEGSIHLPRCTCKRRKPIYQTDLASPFRKVWRFTSAELKGTFSIHFSSREKVGEERISKRTDPSLVSHGPRRKKGSQLASSLKTDKDWEQKSP